MEPTRTGGALSDLTRLLGPAPEVHRKRWTLHAVRHVAVEVAIILGLGLVVAACLPLVIWLWIEVL